MTPQTADPDEATVWFTRYEGAGLDGVVAKDPAGAYRPGERRWTKIKHLRTVDCVVGGYRIAKDGKGIGSLLLGLYDSDGALHHVGHTSSFDAAERRAILEQLQPLVGGDSFGHGRTPGGPSRWQSAADSCVDVGEPGARLRSVLRPSPERPLPPRVAIPPLAARQGAEGLRLRSAVAARSVRARRHPSHTPSLTARSVECRAVMAGTDYSSYLRIDELLDLQHPLTEGAHDEMLFVVIHQAYELWFKLILHELDFAVAELEAGRPQAAMAPLHRTTRIDELLIAQAARARDTDA